MPIFADCPKCQSNLTYQNDHHFVCAECDHEWPEESARAIIIPASSLPVRNSSQALIKALKARSPWQGKKSSTRGFAHALWRPVPDKPHPC